MDETQHLAAPDPTPADSDPLYRAILDAITDLPPDRYALCGATAHVAADAVRRFMGDTGHHVVEFREDGFTVQHPLSCRPNLFACALNRARPLGPPPRGPGRYRCAELDGRIVVMERLGDTSA